VRQCYHAESDRCRFYVSKEQDLRIKLRLRRLLLSMECSTCPANGCRTMDDKKILRWLRCWRQDQGWTKPNRRFYHHNGNGENPQCKANILITHRSRPQVHFETRCLSSPPRSPINKLSRGRADIVPMECENGDKDRTERPIKTSLAVRSPAFL
jgi:hypothetical protein